jgi:hypothetical protein
MNSKTIFFKCIYYSFFLFKIALFTIRKSYSCEQLPSDDKYTIVIPNNYFIYHIIRRLFPLAENAIPVVLFKAVQTMT